MATPQRPIIPTTMRAWQFSSASGGLEKNLHLNTAAPVPAHDAKALGHDKVLIKVFAAAINPIDYKIAELPLVGGLAYGRDAVPGSDFAGVIAAASATDANRKRPGDEFQEGQVVFGRFKQPVKQGAMAEYTIANRSKLALVPEGVEAVDAAGVGTAGLTAYQAIVPYVQAGKGDSVFINGGSGGTGVWSIQIAKAMGCYVVTSCSGSNAEFCKKLGADEVIDYKSTKVVDALKNLKAGGRNFDLLVDNVGNSGELYWQCHHFMSERGRYVQVGVDPGLGRILDLVMKMTWPGFLGGGKRQYQMLTVKDNAQQLGEIGRWMQQHKIKTVTHNGEALDMKDGAKAFTMLKTHRTTGKIVIRVNDE